jgi:hypothetical protein
MDAYELVTDYMIPPPLFLSHRQLRVCHSGSVSLWLEPPFISVECRGHVCHANGLSKLEEADPHRLPFIVKPPQVGSIQSGDVQRGVSVDASPATFLITPKDSLNFSEEAARVELLGLPKTPAQEHLVKCLKVHLVEVRTREKVLRDVPDM